MRVFSPVEMVVLGAVLYLFFQVMAVFPNSPFAGTSLFGASSSTIWSILAVGGALAIAIQVLASQVEFDEQGSKSRRLLAEHAERYISVTPVLVAVVVVVLVVDYLREWIVGLISSRETVPLPELLAVVAFGWVLTVLCADAKNRFNGNFLLQQERFRINRRRAGRELRLLRMLQPPRPREKGSLQVLIGGILFEIVSILAVLLLVHATVFTEVAPASKTLPLLADNMELVYALIPNMTGLAAILWVYVSLITLIIGSFRYVDLSYKTICVLLLTLYLAVTLQAFIENWLTGILLVSVLTTGVAAQCSSVAFSEKYWTLSSFAMPGSSARQISARNFWARYEKLKSLEQQ